MSIKIIHCSDLHLDKAFSSFNPGVAERRKRDLNENFRKIVDYALDEEADVFLIGGDVYDKVNPTNPTRTFFISQIKRLVDSDIYVYMIGGNHDVPKMRGEKNTALEIPKSAGLGTAFTGTEELQRDTIEIDGRKICISGKSYDPANEREDPLKGEELPTDGDLNILLLHASFRGMNVESIVPGMEEQRPIYKSDVEGLDYAALGHFHNHFTRETEDGTVIGNPGSIDRLSFHEEGDGKGFISLTIDDEECSPDFVEIDARELETEEMEIGEGDGDLNGKIESFLEERSDREKILRLRLTGSISLGQQKSFDVRRVYEKARDLFFDFQLNRDELEIEGYGRIYAEEIETAEEAFESHIDRLMEESDEDPDFLGEVKRRGVEYLRENL